MHYVCIEKDKVISVLNYQPSVPDTVLVVEITDEDYNKIQDQTCYFDLSTKSVLPIPDTELEKRQVEKENVEPREFLNSTDWVILRHIRQKTLGISTTLSEQEFLDLEHRRNEAAAKIK
jgi:hypothetical protein